MEERATGRGRRRRGEGAAAGRDELNLAEFPLALLADRSPTGLKTLVFEDRIWDKGRGEKVTRRLVIAASEQYGLPTALDDEVILGLIQWTREDGFQRRTVPFTRYGLIRLLDWRDEGRSYQRLDESLRRWLGVTLYYENAWWDRASRQWVDDHFHLLDHVQLVGGRRNRGRDAPRAVSSFTWNEVIFRSFESGHLKSLDMALYRSLHRPTAKRLYRFLDKRFHFSTTLRFDLKQFACEHIGLSRSYDAAQLKRKLKPAIAELEAAGFLEPAAGEVRFASPRRGEWHVEFRRRPRRPKPARATPGLETELTRRGVTERAAVRLVAQYAAAQIAEKIAAFDALVARSDRCLSRNPAGYLVQSIRDDYATPPGILPPSRQPPAGKSSGRPAVAPSEKPRQKGGSSPASPHAEAVEAYLAARSAEERAALTEAALKAAPRILADGYRRAEANGCRQIAEEYRRHLLDRHVRRLLGIGEA